MGAVLECVVFSVLDGVDRAAVVDAAAAITPWAEAQPGFVSRELFELADGRWVDLVRWTTMASAMQASASAEASPACARFFGLIEPSSVQLLHGEPVLPAAAR